MSSLNLIHQTVSKKLYFIKKDDNIENWGWIPDPEYLYDPDKNLENIYALVWLKSMHPI